MTALLISTSYKALALQSMGTASVVVFLFASLLLLLLGRVFRRAPFHHVGLGLWLLLVSAVGTFAVMNAGEAGKGALWEFPLFVVSLGFFAFVANHALERLSNPRRG